MKTILYIIIGSLTFLLSGYTFACSSCGVQSCYSDYSCGSSYSYTQGYSYYNCNGGACGSCNGTNCGCTDPFCSSVDNTCMSCSTCCSAFGNMGLW